LGRKDAVAVKMGSVCVCVCWHCLVGRDEYVCVVSSIYASVFIFVNTHTHTHAHAQVEMIKRMRLEAKQKAQEIKEKIAVLKQVCSVV
jgi:hypothetical protein